MLIVGAKGFAKEILQVCHDNKELDNLCFYDDINNDIEDLLYDKFPVLRSLEQAKHYFETIDNRFTLGIGNSKLRLKLAQRFTKIGGVFTSSVSSKTIIGNYGNVIANGINILANVTISNDVKIGKGTMIYFGSIITHDVNIGEFVEISPNVNILGRAKIGSFTHLGAGCIIFPDVIIGENVIIGVGAVVNKDIPDNAVAVGIPAKIIKFNYE